MYYDDYIIIIVRLYCIQYRSASLSINPASRAGACTDCEYIECTIAMIIIVILEYMIIIFSLLTMIVLIKLTKRTHYIH